MRSLTWKIFFAFWLVMMLVVAANLLVTWMMARYYEEAGQQSDHISLIATEAVSVYEREGPQGWRVWQEALYARKELRVLLLDELNRNLMGRPLPHRLKFLLQGNRHDLKGSKKDGVRSGKRRHRPIVWPVRSDRGTLYTFVILNPHELSDHLYSFTILLWRIGISLLVVALIAVLLSRYLVRPIRVLQLASKALADGDLRSRVSTRMGKRRDELGQLGIDFDRMAERIQALLEGQQRMLRDVSHELRTPLARQRVALELARKKSGESEYLDRIEVEAERINALIDDILQLVRLDGGESEAQVKAEELVELLKRMIDDANFEHHRVRYTGPSHLSGRVDAKWFYRGVENVVRNALKYSEEEVEVHLELQGSKVIIKVLDRGPGVPESMLDRLFEPFVRVDDARDRESGGYGLGLAIAARSVQLHQGEIKAFNRPRGGLEVRITLPQKDTATS